MKYALIDTANTFFRARHVASRNADTWEKIGMAIHLTMSSVNMIVRNYGIDHVVFCLEGRSWRKDYYPRYKAHRKLDETAMTEREVEENQMFWETYDVFTTYLREKTNASVLRVPNAEADDIIARFIALHSQDEHYIISSDSDFAQLIAPNVKQYNGVMDELHTLEGIFDRRGKLVIDKKTKESKRIPEPEWILFEKCMRGDTSDNVFSAYPGVRTKGTSKKVGLTEAFEDRKSKGFAWNNLMLQRWTDHNGVEHRVLDDYNRNRSLIDLRAQPDAVKDAVDLAIREQISHKDVGQVGSHFMKFCGKYQLNRASENAEQFGRWLNKTYQGALNT